MDSILEAARSPEFVAGLRWGGLLGLVGLLIGLGWRRQRSGPAPIAALATMVAAVFAMPIARSLPTALITGLPLLLLAGVAFPWTRRIPFLPVLAALPGAWFIGRSDLPGRGWVVTLVIAVVAVGGPIIAWFDDRVESPVPSWMFAITAAGVWATVPDTEEILVLLGAIAVPTLLAWPMRVLRLGRIGIHPLVGLFMWAIAWGGRERESAIIGAAAAIGLVAAPISAWFAHRQRMSTPGWVGFLVLASHTGLVLFVTRVAGLEDQLGLASLLAVSAITTALFLWLFVERSVANGAPSLGRGFN